MNRILHGKFDIIGIYPVAGMKALFVLPWDNAKVWEDKKSNDAIALIWEGKLCFRQLYYRRDGLCFKFFNHAIYLEDIISCNEEINFD
nr:MAG TPA: hypothetical protein [Caudoviricetes sp.]